MFFNRAQQAANPHARPQFCIADETTARLGYRIKEFYNQKNSWYTVRTPYSNRDIQPSDAGARRIFMHYSPSRTRIILDNGVYVYNNVTKLKDNLFTYKTSGGQGPIAYVVGIPNKDIATREESIEKAMNEIQPYVNP